MLTIKDSGHIAVLDNLCANQIAAGSVNDLIAPAADTMFFAPGLFSPELVNADNTVRINEVVLWNERPRRPELPADFEGGGVDATSHADQQYLVAVCDATCVDLFGEHCRD